MSHDATNWAIKQRGIKPALKVVLWNLCDRYHPDNGCFPSQETLAEDCEVPRSTLNVYLESLEKAGLIAREQRRKKGSQQQERTRYRFAFEPGFAPVSAENPSPETGHGETDEAESRNAGEPSPENGQSRVQNLDSNLVREPVREPVNEREGASDGVSEGETHTAAERDEPAKLARRVKALELGRHGDPWPGALGSSTDWAVKQFDKLTPDYRRLAEDRRDSYLALCAASKTKPVALGVYLRDHKFLDVPGQQAKAQRDAKIEVAPFGPVWAGLRMMALLAGPERIELPDDLRDLVAATYEARKRGSIAGAERYLAERGIALDDAGRLIFPDGYEAAEMRRKQLLTGFPEVNRLHEQAKLRERPRTDGKFAALADLCEAVPVDSQMFGRWLEYHEARNWPFVPAWGSMRVVFFPKGGPEAIEHFRREATAVMAEAKERIEGHVHAAAE
jgi:hypothetical protein